MFGKMIAKISCNIAVIPCRSGSKRIPKKNIRLLHGKPAIAYTIDAALTSGVFQTVIVSTDSEEIAEIACSFGAVVPFIRESSLSDDHTPVSAVTLDAIKRLDPDCAVYENVCQLMANCPLRNAKDIQSSYWQFVASNADTQISVSEYGLQSPWWAMTCDEHNILSPVFKERIGVRSQDLPQLVCPTGAIWWAKACALLVHGTFYAPNYTGWSMPWERAVDIDTEEDWRLAELIIKQQDEKL
jgi:pseudaminic acid cytidylyltransferase